MKKITLLLTLLGIFQLSAQNIVNENKSIAVNGYAEIEVVPNQIYLSFTVKERQEGKTTITLEETEKLLFTGLKRLDIDPQNLSVGDIGANYEKINWRKKGVQTSSKYNLKLKNAEEIYDALHLLEVLKVKGAVIAKIDHSEKEEFEKEVKIEAIKNAQKQAFFLTTAIGEKTDGVLKIERITVINPFETDYQQKRSHYSYAVAEYDKDDVSEEGNSSPVPFKKMKFTAHVGVIYKLQ